MTKIYLLDPRSEIFQSFITAEQLFQFANRCTRNFQGRTLIVRNGENSRCVDLKNETAKEIYNLVLNLQSQIR
jgi:hypothetical protein